MGELYINDILGRHLPGHLSRSLSTATLLTNKTNYEIIVAALEKYLKELGIANSGEVTDLGGQLLKGSPPWNRDSISCHYQTIRLGSQV